MAQTLTDESVGGSLKTASYTDVCDHLSNTGNKTEEESEFMTRTMLTTTVAWDALYRGVRDHAQLAGQLYSCTSQAREPGSQQMEKNTAPPEGSAAPFFPLQPRHKTPNQNRSILQEDTISEPSPEPTSSVYLLLATSCLPLGYTLDSGRTRKLYTMASVCS